MSFISNPFLISFKEIVDMRLKASDALKVLYELEYDAEEADIKDIDMDLLAPYIHYLYTYQYPPIRASVLRICAALEVGSPVSIIEKYHIDYLVAMSIEQRPTEQQVKVDQEKLAAMRIVIVLIKLRRLLPNSILRALLSFCMGQKTSYHQLIIGYLGTAVLTCPTLANNADVGKLFIDCLIAEPVDSIISLITYCFEHKVPLFEKTKIVSRLITPFSVLKEIDSKILDNASQAIIKLLRTWVGLFQFGMKIGAIEYLLKCIPHQPEKVISIFRVLLKLSGPKVSCIDSFNGFVLCTMNKLGFSERMFTILKERPDIGQLVEFWTALTPSNESHEFVDNNIQTSSNSIVYRIRFNTPPHISNFHLPADEATWDWEAILLYLSTILPYQEIDAQSQYGIQLYEKLLEFFTGHYLSLSTETTHLMTESLVALLNLLIHKSWGREILLRLNFRAALLVSMNNLNNSMKMEIDSPLWTFFKCITLMLTNEDGAQILTKFEMIDLLSRVGSTCKNIDVCEKCLSLINFYPHPGLVIPVYASFLSSPNEKISSLAVEKLKAKRASTPSFHESCFQMLLVPHIKELYNNQKNEQIWNALRLMLELVLDDEKCLAVVANDQQMHVILPKMSHFIYSVVLSHPDSLKYANINQEIMWWMYKGKKKYLDLYDQAISYSFVHSELDPAIITQGDYARIPPHFFGQLTKVKEGVGYLKSQLVPLMDELETTISIKTCRANCFCLAHFASSPHADEIVEELGIAKLLMKTAIETGSCILKGTILQCLSMFHMSYKFAQVLQNMHWQVYKFGTHQCVIPVDPFTLVPIDDEDATKEDEVYNEFPEDFENVNGDILMSFIKMLNPITAKQAKNDLIAVYKENPAMLIIPEVAVYVHKLMSEYSFTTDSRLFIYGIFKNVPLERITQLVADERATAIIRAKIFDILSNNDKDGDGLNKIPICQYPLSELASKKVCPYAIEVYVQDDEFEQAFGTSRDQFYQIPPSMQIQLRQNLVSQLQ